MKSYDPNVTNPKCKFKSVNKSQFQKQKCKNPLTKNPLTKNPVCIPFSVCNLVSVFRYSQCVCNSQCCVCNSQCVGILAITPTFETLCSPQSASMHGDRRSSGRRRQSKHYKTRLQGISSENLRKQNTSSSPPPPVGRSCRHRAGPSIATSAVSACRLA